MFCSSSGRLLLRQTRRLSRVAASGDGFFTNQRQLSRVAAWEKGDGFFTNQLCSTAVDGSEYPKEIRGEMLTSSVDLRSVAAGEVIESPYEITVSSATSELWASTFHTTNRLVTSRPFAQKLGFQDQILPFDLMLFIAGAMSHAERAIVQLGFRNGRYLTPAHAGDTLRKTFSLKSRRVLKSTPNRKLVVLECLLKNQRDETVFAVDKTMLFPLDNCSSLIEVHANAEEQPEENLLRKRIVNNAEQLKCSSSLRQLTAGRLIVHGAARPLTATQSMALSSMGRVVHDRHYNERRYQEEDESKRLFVPGGLVLSLVNSLAGRELHEILLEAGFQLLLQRERVNCHISTFSRLIGVSTTFRRLASRRARWADSRPLKRPFRPCSSNRFQTLHDVSFTSPLHPGEVVTALSYVRSRAESMSTELEKLELVTLGIKNVGDPKSLTDLKLPTALFQSPKPLRTKELRELLHKHNCPINPEDVVLMAHRSLYRAAPKSEPFLL